MAQPAPYMAFIIHCTQLCTLWSSFSPRSQGKFATGTQGPAKKSEKLDYTRICVTNTKPEYPFSFLEMNIYGHLLTIHKG